MKSDTIAAIATALSDAGIGIIRISGPEAIAVANRVVVNKKKEHTLKNWQTHTIHYGFVEENGTISHCPVTTGQWALYKKTNVTL